MPIDALSNVTHTHTLLEGVELGINIAKFYSEWKVYFVLLKEDFAKNLMAVVGV